MQFAYHGRRMLVAAELDGQEASCSDRLDAGERHFDDAITRAEVMEYLSQTYGQVFMSI